MSLIYFFPGCRCNGKTIRRNEKILDGECNSVRRFEDKYGEWKYWCYVDPGEDCEDVQDGWSFDACSGGKTNTREKQNTISTTLGCPNSHVVQTNGSDGKILTDNCSDEDGDDWLAPEGAINEDATVIISLGCPKKIHGLQMKNLKMEQGGTKQFTIMLSNSPEGPWESILVDELQEQETPGCGSMLTFNLE